MFGSYSHIQKVLTTIEALSVVAQKTYNIGEAIDTTQRKKVVSLLTDQHIINEIDQFLEEVSWCLIFAANISLPFICAV